MFKSLSEGEITFITFLYFFQLVTTSSSEIENEKKIIAVIDDPISSLDAHAMSVASLLVRQLINQARQPDENRHVQQVIVLTHNLEFFKQVAPRQGRTDTHYWRLLKKGNVSHAIDCGNNRPVRSGYEHLWEELREESYKLDSTRLQNLMRSIIETYFLLFGDYNKQKLFSGGYMKTPEEKASTESFFKDLDERSHGQADDLYAPDPQQMNNHLMAAFRQFFIKMGHEAHYKMMMRI